MMAAYATFENELRDISRTSCWVLLRGFGPQLYWYFCATLQYMLNLLLDLVYCILDCEMVWTTVCYWYNLHCFTEMQILVKSPQLLLFVNIRRVDLPLPNSTRRTEHDHPASLALFPHSKKERHSLLTRGNVTLFCQRPSTTYECTVNSCYS